MLVIRHIRQLITCAGDAPRRGVDQRTLPIVEDGAVAADGERILFAGADRDLPASLTSAPETRVVEGGLRASAQMALAAGFFQYGFSFRPQEIPAFLRIGPAHE